MMIGFSLKFFYYLFYLVAMILGYIVKYRQPTNLEKWLMTTFVSYSTGRIMTIVSAATYTLISASRTLLFISPSTFHNLNVGLFNMMTISLLLMLTVTEVILSQVVFGPGRCDVNEKGYKLHALTDFFPPPNETEEDTKDNTRTAVEDISVDISNSSSAFIELILSSNTSAENSNGSLSGHGEGSGSVRTCTLFPTLRCILIIFVVLELTRFATAFARMILKLKKQSNTVSLTKCNPGTVGQPPSSNNNPEPSAPKKHFCRAESFPSAAHKESLSTDFRGTKKLLLLTA